MAQQQVAKIVEVAEAVILELRRPRLDADSSAQTIRDVVAIATQYPRKPLIFDVGTLEFIRSSEIGAFVDISKRLRARGQSFSLAGMQTSVRAAFHVSRVDQLVKVYESIYEALGEL
jgi:anti-anti-sigma factor